jgi:hypothetical protein
MGDAMDICVTELDPVRAEGRRGTPRRSVARAPAAVATVASIAFLLSSAVGAAATVPGDVVNAVHGRVVGWTRSSSDWFVVYLDRSGGGWCGMQGASWRIALVETKRLPVRVTADRRLSGAGCGNALAWVQAGRFSDGRHQEAAFMLWATPSLGATTYIYRIDGERLALLARFGGDKVVLGRGTVTVSFENRGRSAHGEIEDVYRWQGGRYRLASRH